MSQVIILTGHATLETAIEALRLGAYDYQFKPVDNMEDFRPAGGARLPSS